MVLNKELAKETETTMARCKERGGTARDAARAVARAEDAGKGAELVRALRAAAWEAL